jgi:hypothetical protein
VFNDLERWLCEMTGYDSFSLQPNSGANGEYAGLMTIRKFFESTDQQQRKVSQRKEETGKWSQKKSFASSFANKNLIFEGNLLRNHKTLG